MIKDEASVEKIICAKSQAILKNVHEIGIDIR